MPTYVNQGLFDTLLQHQHYLLSVEQTAVKAMVQPLQIALKEVKTKLAIMNFDPTTTYTGARLLMLEEQIGGVIEAAARTGTNTLSPLLAEVIQAENMAMTGILKDAMPFPMDSLITLDRLPLEAIENMIQQPLGGQALNGRLKTLVKGAATDAKEAIQTSILLGESTYKTAKRLKDMVEGGTFWKAARIARTEVHRNANEAHLKVFNKHKHILTGLQWTASLDRATCQECGMLDGEIYYYPPVPTGRQSVGSAPTPPIHPHCFIDSQVPIRVPGGEKPIGKIQVGDLVLTHKGRYRKVTALSRQSKWQGRVYKVRTAQQELWLEVTEGHPVLAQVKGRKVWLPIEGLKVGQKLFTPSYCMPGITLSPVAITSIESYSLTVPVTTYNFAVEEDESYIASGLAVHNCRCVLVPITKGWQSLGFTKADLKKFPGLADMDRRAAHQITYKDWFKGQPKDVQKTILGPSRYKKYTQGKFTFNSASQAVSKNLKPLPAASLAKLRGLASNSRPKKSLEYED